MMLILNRGDPFRRRRAMKLVPDHETALREVIADVVPKMSWAINRLRFLDLPMIKTFSRLIEKSIMLNHMS